MNQGYLEYKLVIDICLAIAAICTTLVPLVYALTPWHESHLGRAFMTQAIAFALAMDLTVLARQWQPSNLRVLIWMQVLTYLFVAMATFGVALMIINLNYRRVPMKSTTPLLSNRMYDLLKKTVQLVLPALGALYFALAQIWELPRAEEVVGTIAAVTTFLGIVLGISSNQYNNTEARYDGDMVVTEKDEGGKLYSLDLLSDPEDLDKKDELIFKIRR